MTNQVNTQSVLTFDGQDDYINFGKNDIGGVFAQGSSAFTISGWVNPHQLTNKATTYGAHNVFFARSSDRYSDNFEFGISEEGNLDVYIDENIDNVIKTFGNGELTIGQWHFFAIVFNGGQLTIYLDDHEYTGSLTGSSLNKATSPITMGATLHNNVYFTGQLANISVWNYPCTQDQIQTHRSSPLVGNEPGLVAYWRLNEGEGTTVQDQSGNTHNGTLYGDPSWNLAQVLFAIAQSSSEGHRPSSSPAEIAEIAQTTEYPIPDNIQQQEQAQTPSQEESKQTMNNTANPKYKILAIDGGGIRGIIPAIILTEIEKRTQKQIFSLFDLIAGSSSGGILALGLTKPRLDLAGSDSPPVAQYSAEELLQIYLEYGAEIFYEPFWEQLLGQIEDIFVQPKYSSEGREEIIKQYFGDSPLENNLKEVFVTSYDIEQRIPIFFTNKLEKQQTKSKKFRKLCLGFTLTDAALATSATPTYFAPYRVSSSHNTNGFYTLVDGGLVANNPANLAILEAQISRQENQQALNMEDILVVSLGTGSLTSVYPYDQVKNWGLLQWTKPLLNMVLDGGSEVVAGELERLFEATNKGHKTSYYRFQPFLKSELEDIDNAKPENLRQLQTLANILIQEKNQEIDELCSILSS
ncbi:patatin [Dolichospermum sp. UHCC 0352]|uniref:patatin-like phospholipase family protein n=1 Tax=Dolichospermum sp. UHCC 0352 TaxID=2590011 RepID=UPI00144889B6|nr:patatin [Dolichospermum sp. UHCC 0352]